MELSSANKKKSTLRKSLILREMELSSSNILGNRNLKKTETSKKLVMF